MEIENLIIFFGLYAFSGWIVEMIYRSWNQKRFVNPGFLYGPFVPIYGAGAVIIIATHSFIHSVNIVIQFFLFAFVLSALEYITGVFFEKVYRLKLWDYSDTRFKLNDKVNLIFSMIWALLGLILINFLHPLSIKLIGNFTSRSLAAASVILALYLITDITFSFARFNRFWNDLISIFEKYKTVSNLDFDKIIHSFKRTLSSFPSLNKLLSKNLSDNFKFFIDKLSDKISGRIVSIIGDESVDEEYNRIVKDILSNPAFLMLKNFRHHNSSIYDHAKIVSYIAFKLGKHMNLDYVSIARGGLLHDFFLYDWRNHDEPDLHRKKFHGLEHPKIALKKSMEYFNLNDTEKDIILKHMWPLTIIPPVYKESFLVSFVDKFVASTEFISGLYSKIIH